MNYSDTARAIMSALGGRDNLLNYTVCMTRLRLSLKRIDQASLGALGDAEGVLGVYPRGAHGVELVFGPAVIENVQQAFSLVAGDEGTADGESLPLGADGFRVQLSEGRSGTASESGDLSMLQSLLGAEDDAPASDDEATAPDEPGKKVWRLLVINGPNINLLGSREPGIYGQESYPMLVRRCQEAARAAGFAECRVFQSNHEGDLVDEIQHASGIYDGIIINPAAYTHTSVAILDALKAVRIDAIEVHISKVEDREDFRQVSYVRGACFETITGRGVGGYEDAIADMAKHLHVS